MKTTLTFEINWWWVIGIAAYILVNAILMVWVQGKKRYEFTGTLFLLLTALPLGICAKTYWFFCETLQVKFFWNYYIRKRTWLHKATIKRLYEWNRIAQNEFNTGSLHDKIYRLSVRIVNKKNGYTFGPNSENEYKQYVRGL